MKQEVRLVFTVSVYGSSTTFWNKGFQHKRHKICKLKSRENFRNKRTTGEINYDQHIQEVGYGSFTLLMFSSNAGMGL